MNLDVHSSSSLFLVDLAYIYIYIFLLNTLSGGSARSDSTALSYRNCVITLVGGWWGQGIARAFTRWMMKTFEHQDSLESKMILWKDKVTLQKVGVTSWIIQWKKNAHWLSVAGRENISPIILAHTVTIWICTRLQRVIATGNSTDYFSLCQSVILSVWSHEEIYLNICRNMRGVLTFVIHYIYIYIYFF